MPIAPIRANAENSTPPQPNLAAGAGPTPFCDQVYRTLNRRVHHPKPDANLFAT
jgi:hypothetical protein